MNSDASMQELVEFIAKSLVDDPSQVYVSEIEGESSVILELRVGPEDMGRIIGKGGRTVNAMRTAWAQEEREILGLAIYWLGEYCGRTVCWANCASKSSPITRSDWPSMPASTLPVRRPLK
jgi:predicted RNA-binding protein YlqC (UPF0109 family)